MVEEVLHPINSKKETLCSIKNKPRETPCLHVSMIDEMKTQVTHTTIFDRCAVDTLEWKLFPQFMLHFIK